MKLKKFAFLLALSAIWSLQSCDNNDDESPNVPVELQNALSSKYPNVTNVKWESKAGYYVADFYDQYEISAWFTQDGIWKMTETDIPLSALPQEIQASFENSEYYLTWKVDDVDKLERDGFEIIYVIEVEKQNQEVDLHYSANGTLIKSIVDTDNDEDEYLPVQLTEAIKNFIYKNYSNALIMEVDIENDRNDKYYGYKEILFDSNGNWYSTSWEVHKNELPETVRNVIEKQYKEYNLDDAEYIEKANDTKYYRIDLELGETDLTVNIDSDGNVIP